MRRGTLIVLAALSLALCFQGGCGDDDSGDISVVTPQVTQVYPEDGATDINLNTSISVWFSRDMEETSLDSIYVIGVRSHHVEYDGGQKRATVYLDTILAPETTYQVLVSSYVMDNHGNNIAGDSITTFTTGPFDCEHLRDMFEPNNEAALAPHIEFDKTYALLSSCGSEERNDVFEFTLTDAADVLVSTEAAYVDTEYIAWQMYFERENGDLYAGIGSSFKPERMTPTHHRNFLPGTYYLHLWKAYDDHHFVVYHLTLEARQPCQDDAYEDNDFIDQAVLITPGTIEGLRGCDSDGDFFAVDLVEEETLTVAATEVTTINGARMVEIFGPDHARLTGHVSHVEPIENPIIETWQATETGRYYFWVYWTDDGIVYDLSVGVESP
jgi:hypothetical protein